MADYPVRVQLPPATPARSAPARAYPVRVQLPPPGPLPAGGEARAAGVRAREFVGSLMQPTAADRQMNQIVGSNLSAFGSGAARFIEGLLGMSNGGLTRSNAGTAPKPAAKPAAVAAPAAPEKPRLTVDDVATPQDRALAVIDTLLKNPGTSYQRAMGAIGGLAQTAPKALSPKDASGADVDKINAATFNAMLQDISKQKASGNLSNEEASKATDSAFNTYLKRRAATWGFDPMKITMADLIAQPE